MPFVVYKHTNRNNGKAYVGWTSLTMEERWEKHVKNACYGSTLIFHNAIRKHGVDAWDHAVLMVCDDEISAKAAEIRLIAEYQTFHGDHPDRGYNMTKGGEGILGWKHSEHVLEKLRYKCRGWKHTSEARQKISEALRNRFVTDVTRKKMSESQQGRTISVEHRKKLSESFRGRQLSLETIEKMKVSRTGYRHSDETRSKIGLGNNKYSRSLPVAQCDKDGNVIQVHDSIGSAAIAIDGRPDRIHAVIVGKLSHHRGFTWKWNS